MDIVCVTHVNKSSPSQNMGCIEVVFLLGFQVIFIALCYCLAGLFSASFKNACCCSWDHAAPQVTSFSEASEWLREQTQHRNMGQEGRRGLVLVPEVGMCPWARVGVRIDVCLHGAQQDCTRGKLAAGHLQHKGRVERQLENHYSGHDPRKIAETFVADFNRGRPQECSGYIPGWKQAVCLQILMRRGHWLQVGNADMLLLKTQPGAVPPGHLS